MTSRSHPTAASGSNEPVRDGFSLSSPWDVFVHSGKGPRRRANGNGNSGGWSRELFDRLTVENESPMAHVCSRWARCVDAAAENNIRGAYNERLLVHLQQSARCGTAVGDRRESTFNTIDGGGDLKAVLAHCGSDCADHEATMRFLQRLISTDFPTASIARVGPEDFRSAANATKRTCEQLMLQGERAIANARDGVTAEFDDDEGELNADDIDPRVTLRGVGMMDFVDWHREQGKSAGMAVLLIERLEGVSNTLLLDLLRRFGSACCNHGISCIAIFGLQQPPQSRFELLEGEPLIPLRIVDAVSVLQPQVVCSQLLESIAEDPVFAMPLSPKLIQWLRDQFLYTRRSVTGTLRALVLLCQAHFANCPLARICCLAGVAGAETMTKHQLTKHFSARIAETASDSTTQTLRGLWKNLCELCECGDGSDLDAAIREQTAQAAAEAAIWHKRLSFSIAFWDVLVCHAAPVSRHEARTHRLAKLSRILWPWPAEVSADCCNDAATDDTDQLGGNEAKKVDALLQQTLDVFFEDGGESDKLCRFAALQSDLLQTAKRLPDGHFVSELSALGNLFKETELRNAFQKWFHKLRQLCWKPLTGPARTLFHEICAGPGIQNDVERRLSGTKGLAFEAVLAPLAIGRVPGGEAADDVSLLWRLLQSTAGRRVELSDLWRLFSEHAGNPSSHGEPGPVHKRQRFGLALAALHMLGLHVPRNTGGVGQNSGGWRLHKRYFGRVWRGSKPKAVDLPPVELKGDQHGREVNAPGDFSEDVAEISAKDGNVRNGETGSTSKAAALPRKLGPMSQKLKALLKRPRGVHGWSQRGPTGNEGSTLAPKAKKPRIFMG